MVHWPHSTIVFSINDVVAAAMVCSSPGLQKQVLDQHQCV